MSFTSFLRERASTKSFDALRYAEAGSIRKSSGSVNVSGNSLRAMRTPLSAEVNGSVHADVGCLRPNIWRNGKHRLSYSTMRLSTITWARNEADIIETFVRHHAALADRMIIIDNAGTDETSRILRSLAAEGLPLE